MGNASRGGSCPLCGNYASITKDDRLYKHKGNVLALIGSSRRECRASRATSYVARKMRANKDAGRHTNRNEDGSWLYECTRCGREQRPWPLVRGDRCSPKQWAYCIRPLPQIPAAE